MGPDHSPLFTVEVLVDGEVAGTGQGRKKVDAERAAAQEALERLTVGQS
jgi:ribonuclease-3